MIRGFGSYFAVWNLIRGFGSYFAVWNLIRGFGSQFGGAENLAMRKTFIKIVFFIIGSALFNFELLASDKLIASKNFYEFYQNLKKQKTKKRLEISCFFQLENKKVPYSCYELVEREYSPRGKKSAFRYLNEKCQDFSAHLQQIKRITFMMKNEYLSVFCLEQLKKRKTVLEYQIRDRSGRYFFDWYFKKDF